MSIWYAPHGPLTIDDIRARYDVGLSAYLGIRLTAIGDDFLQGTMPVLPRVHQPMGLLHGGASVVLAESLGSIGANLCVDYPRVRCVGQEINANHVRGVAEGLVTGTARPLHLGARSQVWQIEIRDPTEELVCISRLTIAVIGSR